MQVTQLAEGLWRWTAPHPEWTPASATPSGWQRTVASVYSEPPADRADALLLVDPQLPAPGTPDAERFWAALDRDVERLDLPLAIVVICPWHARSTADIAERYAPARRVEIVVPAAAMHRLDLKPTRTFGDGDDLPGGAVAYAIDGLDPGESALWLPHHRALVFGDAVLGEGGGELRVAPVSWAPKDGAAAYEARFRSSLRRLLDLDPAIVVTAHGDSAARDGRAALAAALDAPPHGADAAG